MSDADALKAARAAVDAARSLREQMREDWGHHVEPEETLAVEVDRLEGENARLRAALRAVVMHNWSDLPEVAAAIVAERYRYRVALRLIAKPADAGCEGCAAIARHALDGSANMGGTRRDG